MIATTKGLASATFGWEMSSHLTLLALAGLTKCSGDMFDTGFYQMSQPCNGYRVVIRRAGFPSTGDISF